MDKAEERDMLETAAAVMDDPLEQAELDLAVEMSKKADPLADLEPETKETWIDDAILHVLSVVSCRRFPYEDVWPTNADE